MATRILETKQENHHPVSYFSHYGNEGKGAGQAVSPGFIRGSAGLVAANSLPRLQPGPDRSYYVTNKSHFYSEI